MTTSPDEVQQYGGWLLAFAMGVWKGIHWWFGLKSLSRLDKQDDAVSSSIRWMLTELRTELARVKQENKDLRGEISLMRITREPPRADS
jgi:cell division protein FtsB